MARRARVRWVDHVGRVLCDMPKVGDMTSELSETCRARAEANLSNRRDGYRYPGFETKDMEMNGKVIRTKTDHARYSQNKSKTLTKALNSLRG